MSDAAKATLVSFLGVIAALVGLAGMIVYANHLEHLAVIQSGLHQEVVDGIAVWVKPHVERCHCKPEVGDAK